MKLVKGQNGQALVEVALVITLVLGIFFSLIQLFHLAVLRMIAFDAAQASARAKTVEKNPQIAGLYVLSSEKIGKQVVPTVKVDLQELKGGSKSEKTKVSIARVDYLQKVMFPSFFSFLGLRWLRGSAICPMINSPQSDYFKKSYPKAKENG